MLIALRLLRAALCLVLFLALAWLWRLLPDGFAKRRWLASHCWGLLLRGFQVRVQVHGVPLAEPKVLSICNHISWLDIAVMGHVLDAGFIAKAEVSDWPVLGALARRGGCLFVERSRRQDVKAQAAQVEARLALSSGLILFPEGTTGSGIGLLPFRSSLFPEGVEYQVQPVSLIYKTADGRALASLDDAHLRRIAWLDDDGLLNHVIEFAKLGGVRLDVWFEAPFAPSNRKQAAHHGRAVIERRLCGTA